MKPVSVPQRGIYVAFCAAKPSGGVNVLRMAEWPTLILHSYRAPPLTMNAARSVASTLMEYGAPEVGNQPTCGPVRGIDADGIRRAGGGQPAHPNLPRSAAKSTKKSVRHVEHRNGVRGTNLVGTDAPQIIERHIHVAIGHLEAHGLRRHDLMRGRRDCHHCALGRDRRPDNAIESVVIKEGRTGYGCAPLNRGIYPRLSQYWRDGQQQRGKNRSEEHTS